MKAGVCPSFLARVGDILPVAPGRTLPPDWRAEGELLDHGSLTGWLLTYWEGAWRGYW
jgi:hypothetical protein